MNKSFSLEIGLEMEHVNNNYYHPPIHSQKSVNRDRFLVGDYTSVVCHIVSHMGKEKIYFSFHSRILRVQRPFFVLVFVSCRQ